MKERLGQGRESRPVYEGEIGAGRAGLCIKERLGQEGRVGNATRACV